MEKSTLKVWIFYRKVFEAIKAKGIRLLVNLYHFDLPFALQEDGDGWENKATVSAYEDYARFVLRLMEI